MFSQLFGSIFAPWFHLKGKQTVQLFERIFIKIGKNMKWVRFSKRQSSYRESRGMKHLETMLLKSIQIIIIFYFELAIWLPLCVFAFIFSHAQTGSCALTFSCMHILNSCVCPQVAPCPELCTCMCTCTLSTSDCLHTAELEGPSLTAGGPCATMPPLWHQAAIVLLSWSIMSSKRRALSRREGTNHTPH